MYRLDMTMEENNKQIVIDLEPEQRPDNDAESLVESGFEAEQPETDFDERM